MPQAPNTLTHLPACTWSIESIVFLVTVGDCHIPKTSPSPCVPVPILFPCPFPAQTPAGAPISQESPNPHIGLTVCDLAACYLPPLSPPLTPFYLPVSPLFLKCSRHTPASGPSFFAIPLPGKLSPKFQWVLSVPLLGLVTYPVRPSPSDIARMHAQYSLLLPISFFSFVLITFQHTAYFT